MDKISVIIPIYNSEQFLEKCLETVINQTYKNLEIICINDGSEDNSLVIANKYKQKDERIILINKANQGVSSARNDGINRSTGEYITFVDADDWLELNAIEKLYNAIIKNKADVVRGDYYRNYNYSVNELNKDKIELKNILLNTKDNKLEKEFVDRLLTDKIPGYVFLLLIRKSKILNKVLFKEDVKLLEDTIFVAELINNIENIYFLDEPIYHYYCNKNSCTKSNMLYARNMNNLVIVNNYLIKTVSKDNNYRISLINTDISNRIISQLFAMYKNCNCSKKQIISEINKLLDNKEAYKILKSADLTTLPMHLRTSIKLVINKQYNMLIIFFKFRKIMSKIKDILNKRKE